MIIAYVGKSCGIVFCARFRADGSLSRVIDAVWQLICSGKTVRKRYAIFYRAINATKASVG
jgi:hypothetical protein